MRGKIVVVVFVIASAAFALFAAWYLFNRSPVDQRFNLARQRVPSTITDTALLPRTLDEFQSAGNVVSDFAGTNKANYIDNDYLVEFAVTTVKGLDTVQVINSTLAKPNCQDGSGNVISHHDSGKIPYSYSTCSGKYGYNFQWLNGDWLFSASASDPEALLRFANLYTY
jgi:hypothetical protein